MAKVIHSEQTLLPILDGIQNKFKFKLFQGLEIIENGDAKKEIDFLLVFEEYNLILIIEAKGGKLDYIDGKWVNKKNKGVQKDPFKQARQQKRELGNLLNLKEYGKDIIQYLVWFTESSITKYPPGNENNFLDFKSNQYRQTAISEKINSLLKDKEKVSTFFNKYISTLTKHENKNKSISDLLEDKSSEIDKNTESLLNKNLTSAFIKNKDVIVTGTAGTGKSFYAKHLAELYSEKGMKVLYLCYNLIFGKQINEKSNDKYIANDVLSFFNQYYDTTIPDSLTEKKEITKFYTETLPKKINEIFKKINENEKYDVIIIDEAQDFNKTQLSTVFSIGKKDCKHFIFRDEFQKLYEKNLYNNNTNHYFHIEFSINYRNPTKILDRVKEEFEFIKNTEVESYFKAIEGKNKNIEFSDVEELKTKLKKEINLLLSESVQPGKIWILAGDNYKEKYSFLDEMEINDKITVKYIDNKMQNFKEESVINLTRPSLVKGLEFKFVMIIDSDNWVPKYDTKDIKLHVYTAITRCTDSLYNFRLKK